MIKERLEKYTYLCFFPFIFMHEYAHFYMAKILKVKADKPFFSTKINYVSIHGDVELRKAIFIFLAPLIPMFLILTLSVNLLLMIIPLLRYKDITDLYVFGSYYLLVVYLFSGVILFLMPSSSDFKYALLSIKGIINKEDINLK